MRKRGTAISPWMTRNDLCEDRTHELKDPKSDIQTAGANMPARMYHRRDPWSGSNREESVWVEDAPMGHEVTEMGRGHQIIYNLVVMGRHLDFSLRARGSHRRVLSKGMTWSSWHFYKMILVVQQGMGYTGQGQKANTYNGGYRSHEVRTWDWLDHGWYSRMHAWMAFWYPRILVYHLWSPSIMSGIWAMLPKQRLAKGMCLRACCPA